MNTKPLLLAALLAAGPALPLFAQDNAALGVIEEKLNKVRAELEDLQFRQQKTDKALETIQADIKELRRNASSGTGSATPEDLKALEAKIAAVDAARQKDNKTLIDELAKQLAALGSGTKPTKPPVLGNTGNAVGAGEYVVQKGDTLSSIARQNGVSIAALKKANNLAGDSLAIGQKLTLPPK